MYYNISMQISHTDLDIFVHKIDVHDFESWFDNVEVEHIEHYSPTNIMDANLITDTHILDFKISKDDLTPFDVSLRKENHQEMNPPYNLEQKVAATLQDQQIGSKASTTADPSV